MKRTEKLYATLDALALDYQALLIKEFEKDAYSSYLYHCLDDVHAGREYCVHGKAETLEITNELLRLEKQIRQLCLKLAEPLPSPILVLEEYVTVYRDLKKQKTTAPWHTDDFEGEHRHLRKRMIQKLLG